MRRVVELSADATRRKFRSGDRARSETGTRGVLVVEQVRVRRRGVTTMLALAQEIRVKS
jgi:hypothetical protein